MSSAKNPKRAPRVLRGSLIVLKRKCGKANCRCARGQPHQTPALSYSLGGVTRIVTLRAADVAAVRAALARYRREVARWERAALTGIATLRRLAAKAKGR